MDAREEILSLYGKGAPGPLRDRLDALERQVTEKTLRDAAVTIRAQAPKYLDNEVDEAIFYALDLVAGLIDPDKK